MNWTCNCIQKPAKHLKAAIFAERSILHTWQCSGCAFELPVSAQTLTRLYQTNKLKINPKLLHMGCITIINITNGTPWKRKIMY